MKKRQRTNTRKGLNVEGITLIALVVTIVVLLILASVSITAVFGDNGLLKLAKEAGEKTNEAKDKDLRQIAMAEALMSFENKEYKGVTIPAGFAPTRIEGEDSIEDGLVIIDSKGNEFVWVPVDGVEGENDVDAENGEKIIYKQDTTTWSSKAYYYNEYKDWWDEEDIDFRKQSVKDNGGFYVARYEAGVPESINYDETTKYKEKSNETNRNKKAEEVTKENLPASKKGLQAWNFVSQTSAKNLSEKMYADSTSVTSRLIDSQAWDTICHWLSKDDKDKVIKSSSWGNYVDADSGGNINGLYTIHSVDYGNEWAWEVVQGNYKRGSVSFQGRSQSGEQTLYELATGISERNKAKNIYDFAGNMWEWTTEIGSHSLEESKPTSEAGPNETETQSQAGTHTVMRGGSFQCYGSWDTAATRSAGNERTSTCDRAVGFRPVLYIR